MAAGRFSKLGAQAEQATAKALYGKAREIMRRSDELVPVDTGTLKGSGRVLLPETHGGTVSVTCGYGYGKTENPETGETAAGYAIYVHERTELKHEPPTQAKFLETAGLELLPTVPADVAVEIRRSFKEGHGRRGRLARIVGRGDFVDVLGE